MTPQMTVKCLRCLHLVAHRNALFWKSERKIMNRFGEYCHHHGQLPCNGQKKSTMRGGKSNFLRMQVYGDAATLVENKNPAIW